MRKITRISYFRKNERKVFNQMAFGHNIKMVLDTTNMHTKWTGKILCFVTFLDKKTGRVLHKFRIEPKKDKFTDLTCKRNCLYSYALAIRSNWLLMKSETVPITRWYGLDDRHIRRFRVELKGDEFVVRYKDKYNNVVWDKKLLKIFAPNLSVFIGKIRRLINLKQVTLHPLLLKSFIKKSGIDSSYRHPKTEDMLHE